MNQFLIRASGGVAIDTNAPAAGTALDVNGTVKMKGFRMSQDGALAGSVLTLTAPADGTGEWQPAGSTSWSLTGNTGTTPGTNFIGTKDPNAFEIKVNNSRALRLEPNATSPNLIGGHPDNAVTGSYGSFIGGGGGAGGTGGNANTINAGQYGIIGGGAGNEINGGQYATIAGVDAIEKLLRQFGVKEFVRTGTIGILRGSKTVASMK